MPKLFADTMKQMGMDAMHEDNNLLFSTSDVAKILAFSKMVEQELGKKIEHENDTPEKEQSQEHGQDQERQANARGWSDYPATPEQIDLTATVLAADEGVSIDEIKKDFSENPSNVDAVDRHVRGPFSSWLLTDTKIPQHPSTMRENDELFKEK